MGADLEARDLDLSAVASLLAHTHELFEHANHRLYGLSITRATQRTRHRSGYIPYVRASSYERQRGSHLVPALPSSTPTAASPITIIAMTSSLDHFLTAIRCNNIDTITAMLSTEPELVYYRTSTRETPLFFAPTAPVAKLLLDCNAELDATNLDHETALFQATIRGCEQVVVTLLAAGARVTQCNTMGVSPILLAIEHLLRDAIVDALLEARADPNTSWCGQCILSIAAHRGRYASVESLVYFGADKSRITEHERNAMSAAMRLHLASLRRFTRNLSISTLILNGWQPLVG